MFRSYFWVTCFPRCWLPQMQCNLSRQTLTSIFFFFFWCHSNKCISNASPATCHSHIRVFKSRAESWQICTGFKALKCECSLKCYFTLLTFAKSIPVPYNVLHILKECLPYNYPFHCPTHYFLQMAGWTECWMHSLRNYWMTIWLCSVPTHAWSAL